MLAVSVLLQVDEAAEVFAEYGEYYLLPICSSRTDS